MIVFFDNYVGVGIFFIGGIDYFDIVIVINWKDVCFRIIIVYRVKEYKR